MVEPVEEGFIGFRVFVLDILYDHYLIACDLVRDQI